MPAILPHLPMGDVVRFLLLCAVSTGAAWVLGRSRSREELTASFIIVALVGALVLMGTR